MIPLRGLGGRYYRLGLAAAKQRNLSTALVYADFACLLDPDHGDAAHLAEICRYELGEAAEGREPALERIGPLVKQKQWKAAALAARAVPHQNVWLLTLQGCLWALAKRDAPAADCFARALEKDRENRFAAEALAYLGRRRKCFWRFFCCFLMG